MISLHSVAMNKDKDRFSKFENANESCSNIMKELDDLQNSTERFKTDPAEDTAEESAYDFGFTSGDDDFSSVSSGEVMSDDSSYSCPSRKALLGSIRRLGSHVSESVVQYLVQKVRDEERESNYRTCLMKGQGGGINFGLSNCKLPIGVKKASSETNFLKMQRRGSTGGVDQLLNAQALQAMKRQSSFCSLDSDGSYEDYLDFVLDDKRCNSLNHISSGSLGREDHELENSTNEVTRLRHSRTDKALHHKFLNEWATSKRDLSDDEDYAKPKTLPINSSHFCSEVHTSAICLIDISGFTNLSQRLELDSLSQAINNYFQMIVEEVSAYKGDVLKFAGDAIFAEWKVGNNGFDMTKVVLMASSCAASIVNKCSDFPVKIQGNFIATLNVHCGLGFGDVLEAHIPGVDRVEPIILGDTIQQIADALNVSKQGEVAASPEVLACLSESVVFDPPLDKVSSSQIIAYKSVNMFYCKTDIPIAVRSIGSVMDDIICICRNWEISALHRLQSYMSHYVHPVALAEIKHSASGEYKKKNQSMAELREVFTVFIQPQVDIDLMGKEIVKDRECKLLNKIMLIISAEVIHFKGHLRQFIVDDKGLVIIANFGLRGSTFPNMIEERAMPCLTNIKTLLKTELAVESRLGATFGKAYCGVVGGIHRHEYAVLGPSVNLAARLMGHKDNPGILVDEAVKAKASSHPFESLPPVVAKGYNSPVKIFKPKSPTRKSWKDDFEYFVGRDEELSKLESLANSVMAEKTPKIVLIASPHGSGKSLLLANGVKHIEVDLMLNSKKVASCLTCCHIFEDEDSFQPFSIVRPLLLKFLKWKTGGKDELRRKGKISHPSNIHESKELDEAQLFVVLLQKCMEAGVPLKYVEIFGGLTFTSKLSDIGKWSDRNQKMSEWNQIIEAFVKLFCHFSRQIDLVLMALDCCACMDEMSWKIVELLYERAQNVLIIGACRNYFDMNIHPIFWDKLKNDASESDRFTKMVLGPLSEGDMRKLCSKVLGKDESKVDEKFVRIVSAQSDGNPFMARAILEQLYKDKNEVHLVESSDFCNLEELLIHRLDSLSPSVRSYLNLGAIVGFSFAVDDLIDLLDICQEIQHEEPSYDAESIRKRLHEAVRLGILDTIDETSFTFTHQFWADNMLKLTPASWKDDIKAFKVKLDFQRLLKNRGMPGLTSSLH